MRHRNMSIIAKNLACRLKRIRNCNSVVRLTRQMRMFKDDERGNFALIFAIIAVPLVLVSGAAIDYTRVMSQRGQVQDALDAAALAAARRVNSMTESELLAYAQSFFDANLPSGVSASLGTPEVTRSPTRIKLTASGSTVLAFGGLMNINSMSFSVSSTSVSDPSSLELIMVLDNSGSMGGNKISALRTGANALIDILFENPNPDLPVSVGIVPFTLSVNVDPANKNAGFMDTSADADIHRTSFLVNTDNMMPSAGNRFELFDLLENKWHNGRGEWAGCVEARKYPLDIQDTAPSGSDVNSFFTPYFAPDMRYGSSYNNYLSGYQGDSTSGTPGSLISRYGKYYNRNYRNSYAWGVPVGPNWLCTAQPILPLTENETTLHNKINSMTADGGTNIHQGVIWGLRALSPQVPFTEGRAYDDDDNLKFMIVMSDGANWHYGNSYYPGKSIYSAYGFSSEARLGNVTSSSSTLKARMNDRTRDACSAAKDAGVKVFTIAFDLNDAATTSMLRNCATNTSMSYMASSTSELIEAFEEIADNLDNIRIAE